MTKKSKTAMKPVQNKSSFLIILQIKSSAVKIFMEFINLGVGKNKQTACALLVIVHLILTHRITL